jgi:Ca2+-binding EF-hand superfamily protein
MRRFIDQAPKRKRQPATRPQTIPPEMESRINNVLESLQKESTRREISDRDIQTLVFDPLQLQDEGLKAEIIQQHSINQKETIDILLQRIWESYQQQQRANQVFTLLDEAGKGVVVVQDLQRVVQELFEEEVNDEDLEEMIREFDQSGDGLLYPDDILRIARLVGLSE